MLKSDLPFLLEVRNDESTRSQLENDSVFTLEECELWYDTLESEWYIIEVNNDKVGYIRTTLDGEVGMDIHMNHRRRGYASKAYKKYLSNKSFASLWVFETNHAFNLYKKLGFKETGEHKLIRNRKYIRMEYNGKN